jgi:hypothetical protein
VNNNVTSLFIKKAMTSLLLFFIIEDNLYDPNVWYQQYGGGPQGQIFTDN